VGSREVELGGGGLVEGKLADSGEDREILRSRVEEQGPNDLLDPSLFRGRGDKARVVRVEGDEVSE
jgi:hypothetical protein